MKHSRDGCFCPSNAGATGTCSQAQLLTWASENHTQAPMLVHTLPFTELSPHSLCHSASSLTIYAFHLSIYTTYTHILSIPIYPTMETISLPDQWILQWCVPTSWLSCLLYSSTFHRWGHPSVLRIGLCHSLYLILLECSSSTWSTSTSLCHFSHPPSLVMEPWTPCLSLLRGVIQVCVHWGRPYLPISRYPWFSDLVAVWLSAERSPFCPWHAK